MTVESLENDDELNVRLNIWANEEDNADAECNGNKIADRYFKKEKIGEGAYGIVFKATDTATGQTVAVKRIRLGKYKERVNNNAIREIKLLKELKDPNIIDLIDTFTHKGNLHLVFEYMETDLEAVIRDQNNVLSPADVKSYMQMTLKALAFCHKKGVLHRDMKPNNLLIAADGQLKLADFGLARIFGSSEHKYTHQVFARWYRAPELLFGSKQYGTSVDIWAAGCIFAELLLRRPFLQGSSDIDQLGKIFAAFGTPEESQWPDMIHLPDYLEYQHIPAPSVCSLFPMASDDALDLLSKMFAYDPKSRISAEQALEHEYFSSQPLPTLPEKLPKPHKKGTSVSSDHINVSQKEGPLLLSPSRKIRRVTPGNPNRHDMVANDHFMNTIARVPTTGSSVDMPMSIDTGAFSYSHQHPRPTLNSADKTHLKRKLVLDPEFSYSN